MQPPQQADEQPIVVLVADDDPATLAVTARLLRIAGYQVIEAGSGAEAEAQTLAARPDLVLLDVDLGDADGRDVCARLKSHPALADTFFILASGVRTSSDEQATGLEFGADGYIARPIGNRELLARVESFVRIRSAERERRAYETFLQRAHRLESLGALAAGIGREVSQPIAEAVRRAETLRTRLPPESDLLELADQIIDRCKRTLAVVQSLGRIADRSSTPPGGFDPGEVIREVLDLIHHQLTVDDQILLTIDVPPDLPRIQGDRSEVAQAIASLVVHGRDAVCERFPQAHPGKRLAVSARATSGGGRVRISIADAGPGLAPDACEHTFDPFYNVDGIRRGDRIALALVRGMVKAQQGELTLESTLGIGSTFHIDLPSVQDDPAGQGLG